LIIQFGLGIGDVTLPLAYSNDTYKVAIGGHVEGSLAIGIRTSISRTPTSFYVIGNCQRQYNTAGNGDWISIGY